ncbi:hypothetical protein V8C44DRAFT_55622 [Trichoderma aethiopicum]
MPPGVAVVLLLAANTAYISLYRRVYGVQLSSSKQWYWIRAARRLTPLALLANSFPRFPWLQWQAAAKPNPLAPLSALNISKHSRRLYLVFEQVRRQSGYMCLRTWGSGNHFLCFLVRIPWQLTKGASFRQVLVLLSPSSHRAEFDACHYLRVSRLLHFSFAGGGRKGVPTEDHPRIEIGSSWPAAFDLPRY